MKEVFYILVTDNIPFKEIKEDTTKICFGNQIKVSDFSDKLLKIEENNDLNGELLAKGNCVRLKNRLEDDIVIKIRTYLVFNQRCKEITIDQLVKTGDFDSHKIVKTVSSSMIGTAVSNYMQQAKTKGKKDLSDSDINKLFGF